MIDMKLENIEKYTKDGIKMWYHKKISELDDKIKDLTYDLEKAKIERKVHIETLRQIVKEE